MAAPDGQAPSHGAKWRPGPGLRGSAAGQYLRAVRARHGLQAAAAAEGAARSQARQALRQAPAPGLGRPRRHGAAATDTGRASAERAASAAFRQIRPRSAAAAGQRSTTARPGRASAGASRSQACANGPRRSRATDRRLTPAARQLGDRLGGGGGARRARRLACRGQNAAADPDDHQGRPTYLLDEPARAARARRAKRRARRSSATPWTACSRDWRPRSRPSASSSPTPRTSCAPR